MNLSLRSLIFQLHDPKPVAELVAYMLDLEFTAKNCDQFELINTEWAQFPQSIIFRTCETEQNYNDQILQIEILDKQDWQDHFKKIVFYLHQNELGERFSPSKEMRKPGGISFQLTLATGLILEFFHPMAAGVTVSPAL